MERRTQVRVHVMVSKNITITEDAYERLKRCKRADESFSDVINRLTNAGRDPLEFVGTWTGTEIAAAAEAASEEFERDLEERERELSR